MKVLNFAVSVQYGNGHHYFVRSDLETQAQLEEVRVQQQRRLFPCKHKGVKPKIHVWERKEAFSG